MYKQSATKLLELPKNDLKTWINEIDTILTDCDGVLWNLNEVIDKSDAVINRLIAMGKKVFFATNNSTRTNEEFAEKAVKLGFNIDKNGILCSANVAAKYLADMNFKKKVYVIGQDGIGQALNKFEIAHIGIGPDVMPSSYADFIKSVKNDPDVGAVIVGFDQHISFPKLTRAATYLSNPDCIFIATNTDEQLPLPNVVVPGAGSMVRSVETITYRKAIVMGKPNPNFCADLIKSNNIKPDRTLMIGDRGNTDMLLGTNCKFQTLLVGSGIHKMEDVERWKKGDNVEEKKCIPDFFIPKLGDLLPHLE